VVQPDGGRTLRLRSARDLQQLIGNLVRDPAFAAHTAPGRLHARRHRHAGPQQQPRARCASCRCTCIPTAKAALLLSRDVTALEQAEAMRRDFVANVSHEIRTPLTVLAGFVETLQTLPLRRSARATWA
jgi:two-component system phosphate regulon sensor histidine kinase PhoR